MTIKQLNEKRKALLTELDAADEKRTAEIKDELEKIRLKIETLRSVEADEAAEQREADLLAARNPSGAQKTAEQPADAAMRMAFTAGATTEKKPEARAAVDSYDTPEYRNAFMRFCQTGTPIPAQLRPAEARANQTTTTGDVTAVIPTTIANEIISKLETYGSIYAAVTKTNVQGGVKVPILTLKPEAKWIGETTPSDTQKLKADDSVTFSYYGLECKIAQTLLVGAVTLDAFQKLFIPLATEAMVKAIEIAIFNGAGTASPLGITKDSRVPAANKIALTDADFKSWAAWKKKVFAKMKKSYRKGTFFMAQSTFDGYIDGMTDSNGQPIGRVNYGIADGENYRFGGKTVETVEDELIAAYDDASAGDIVAVFVDLKNYAINSNLEMSVVKWTDHDTNEIKNKVIMVVDGKLLDANGVLIITKGSATA